MKKIRFDVSLVRGNNANVTYIYIHGRNQKFTQQSSTASVRISAMLSVASEYIASNCFLFAAKSEFCDRRVDNIGSFCRHHTRQIQKPTYLFIYDLDSQITGFSRTFSGIRVGIAILKQILEENSESALKLIWKHFLAIFVVGKSFLETTILGMYLLILVSENVSSIIPKQYQFGTNGCTMCKSVFGALWSFLHIEKWE